MKRHCIQFIVLLTLSLSTTLQAQLANNIDRPKLVVGIVVDQMRWDYLYRFYDRYGNDGFKRMLNDGFTVENNLIPYVPTVTAIGHSTVYTGSVPAIHGIAGNDFYIRETQTEMYCAQDDGVKGVGLDPEDADGKMSPKNLLTSTVTDELKLATDFQSKVVGISLKDRGAIMPAGHFADAAYWMVNGNWISSTFYMEKLPGYVQDFNKTDFTAKYLKDGWNTLYPLETYQKHIPDENPYEGSYIKDEKVNFPIKTGEISTTKGRDVIKSTPFGNTITLDFAKLVLDKEKLGNNPAGVPDFLAVSLSSTDYVGHQFAINSAKIEDTYLRLDKDLGAFFTHLDQKVGKGNYTVFLTADHGAAHNPKFILDEKGNAGFFDRKGIGKELENVLKAEFGVEKLIYAVANYQLFLDHKLMEEKNLDEEKIKSAIIRFMKKQKGVLYAVDMEKLSQSNMPEKLKNMAINGYHFKRSGDILLVLEPQWYSSSYTTGTTHGAWNPYDSHIPLVFMGWGIKKGNTHAPTYMTDIAPTVSALLHIQQPNGNIGEPIVDLLDK